MGIRCALASGAGNDFIRADVLANKEGPDEMMPWLLPWQRLSRIQVGVIKRRTLALVREKRDPIRRLALALLERETLTGEEVEAVLSGGALYMEKFPHLAIYMKPVK